MDDIGNIMANIWRPAIDAQLAMHSPLFPKSNKPPLHGPPIPPLLVRDLIKRLSALNPDAYVYTEDYEYGEQPAHMVAERNEGEYVVIK